MKLARVPSIAAVCLLLGTAAACGGGGSSSTAAPDLDKVPTATLPATLPEPQIIGGGAIQPGGGSTYTVRSGDSLAAIAERFGISLEDLRAANPGIDPANLHVGDTVRLPEGTEPAPATATPAAAEATPTTEPEPQPTDTPAATTTPSSLGQTYVVQPGDIPVTIAEKFGITVEELLAANPGIDPTNLQVGQVLVIPPKRTEG